MLSCIPRILGALAMMCVTSAAWAQGMPNATQQEVLVKTTLLTFNDANMTGNYTVLHAKLSKPFRDQFGPDKLKEVFKDFADKELSLTPIARLPIVETSAPAIDNNGILTLTGYFDTKPKQVKYQLRFLPSDGAWKPLGIKVDVD
jgi:hypothetical protein